MKYFVFLFVKNSFLTFFNFFAMRHLWSDRNENTAPRLTQTPAAENFDKNAAPRTSKAPFCQLRQSGPRPIRAARYAKFICLL